MITEFKGKQPFSPARAQALAWNAPASAPDWALNLVAGDVQQDALDKAAAEMQAAGRTGAGRPGWMSPRPAKWKPWRGRTTALWRARTLSSLTRCWAGG